MIGTELLLVEPERLFLKWLGQLKFARIVVARGEVGDRARVSG